MVIHSQSLVELGQPYDDFEWYGFMQVRTKSNANNPQAAIELLRKQAHYKKATHIFNAKVVTYTEGHPSNNYWNAKVEGDFARRKPEPQRTGREQRAIIVGEPE